METELPLKKTAAYCEKVSVRVEPELKEVERKLKARQIDTAELARRGVRRAYFEALVAIEREGGDAA